MGSLVLFSCSQITPSGLQEMDGMGLKEFFLPLKFCLQSRCLGNGPVLAIVLYFEGLKSSIK